MLSEYVMHLRAELFLRPRDERNHSRAGGSGTELHIGWTAVANANSNNQCKYETISYDYCGFFFWILLVTYNKHDTVEYFLPTSPQYNIGDVVQATAANTNKRHWWQANIKFTAVSAECLSWSQPIGASSGPTQVAHPPWCSHPLSYNFHSRLCSSSF